MFKIYEDNDNYTFHFFSITYDKLKVNFLNFCLQQFNDAKK